MKKVIIMLIVSLMFSATSCQSAPLPEESKGGADQPSYMETAKSTSYQYPAHSDTFTSDMTAQVMGASEGIMGYAPIEYQEKTSSAYPETPENTTAELAWFGKTLTGYYTRTLPGGYHNHPIYEYETADRRATFGYSPDGELISVGIVGLSYNHADKCEEATIVEKASEFMSQRVDITQYATEITYDEASAAYTVRYTKHLGGIPTADSARLIYTAAGELAFFTASLLGQIPTDVAVPIDVDEALYLVHERLCEIYEPIKATCDFLYFEQPSCLFTLLADGSYALIVEADVDALTKEGDEVNVRGSEVRFIVR